MNKNTFYRALSWRAITVIGGFILGYMMTSDVTSGMIFASADSAVRFVGQLIHDGIFDSITK